MTAATFRATIARSASAVPQGPRRRATEVARARRWRLRRIATTVSKNGVWIVPSLALAWPRADVLLLSFMLVILAGAASLAAVVDETSSDRSRGVPHRLDRQLAVLLFATFIIGALDIGRLHWADGFHPHLRLVGTLALGVGYLLRTVVMGTNQFFADVITVQWDRAHVVCDVGPYAYVRHPGDLSAIAIVLMIPLAMGSLLAAVPAFLAVSVIVRRCRIEDTYLRENLVGYPRYAERVPHKLLPHVY